MRTRRVLTLTVMAAMLASCSSTVQTAPVEPASMSSAPNRPVSNLRPMIDLDLSSLGRPDDSEDSEGSWLTFDGSDGLFALDDMLVVARRRGFVVYATDTWQVIRHSTSRAIERYPYGHDRMGMPVGDALLEIVMGQAYFRGLATGEERWQRPFPPPIENSLSQSPLVAVEQRAEALILALSWGSDVGAVVALEARTGREIWRQAGLQADDPTYMWEMLVAGDRVMVLTGSTLFALDAETGELRWDEQDFAIAGTESSTRPSIVATTVDDQDLLIVGIPYEGFRVIDIASGARVRDIAEDGLRAELDFAVADGRLYVAHVVGGDDADEGGESIVTIVVTCFDLTSYERQWASDPLQSAGYYLIYGLQVGRDSLYGCTGGGQLLAWDVRTGAPAWFWGVGSCEGFELVEGATVEEDIIVANMIDGRAMVFSRGEAEAPVHDLEVTGVVTIDGEPSAGEHVQIADSVVVADQHGRFRSHNRARGFLRFHLSDLDLLECFNGPVAIDLEREGGPNVQNIELAGTADRCE